MEEVIQYWKKELNMYEYTKDLDLKNDNYFGQFEEQIKMIRATLNRLEQLEKENTSLKKQVKLLKDNFKEALDEAKKDYFVPKSVIREKLEESEKEDYFKKYYDDYQVNAYDYARGYKRCLKELLGDEQ